MKSDFKADDKLDSFSKDFALAIRQDGRTYGQISNIIDWMYSGTNNADF